MQDPTPETQERALKMINIFKPDLVNPEHHPRKMARPEGPKGHRAFGLKTPGQTTT